MARIDERLREEADQMRETLNAASEAARRYVHARPCLHSAHRCLCPPPCGPLYRPAAAASSPS